MQISFFLAGTSCLFLLLFSIHLLLAKKGNQLLNNLLSLVFFSRFGQVLISLLIISGNQYALPFSYQALTPFFYAAPACFYLYLTSLIHGRTHLRKIELLHFIPVALAIIHVIPWQTSGTVNWDIITEQIIANKYHFITEKSGLFPAYFYYVGRPVLVLGYLSAAWFTVIRSKIVRKKNPDDIGRKWVFFALKTATFFQLAGFLQLILAYVHMPNSSFVILNCLALLTIIVFVLHQPKIFYGYLFVAVDWDQTSATLKEPAAETKVTTQVSLPVPSTQKRMNPLTEQLTAHSAIMKEFMRNEQPFLLHDFQIIDLAGKLNIPVHHCSFIINNLIGKNFRDWINGYRIDFFLTQYPVKRGKKTIEAVAYEAGFKSLATFYNAFKKETGFMPTAYFAQELAV
jgi:AraC-like DNA-binding protein